MNLTIYKKQAATPSWRSGVFHSDVKADKGETTCPNASSVTRAATHTDTQTQTRPFQRRADEGAECGRVLLSSGSAAALSAGSAAVGVSRAPQVNEPMNEHVDKLTTESELCHYMCARRTDTPKLMLVPWEGSCHTPNTLGKRAWLHAGSPPLRVAEHTALPYTIDPRWE